MKFFRLNPYFFIVYFIALVAGAIILFAFKKGEILLLINQHHNTFLDQLFYYGTSMGNGLFYLAVILVLACIRYRYALLGLVSFSITGILVLLLKNLIFPGELRPKIFFEETQTLHFVDGVKILSYYSFPSGHTAMAFSLFCLLSITIPQKKYGLVFIVFALIGGISRIYLAQHFFVDVYFGSLFGVTVTILCNFYLNKAKWFHNKPSLEKNLFELFN